MIIIIIMKDRRHEAKTQNSLKLRESTFYTHMWGFAEVSEFFITVLRVYGPVLRHSYKSSSNSGTKFGGSCCSGNKRYHDVVGCKQLSSKCNVA